MVTTQPIGLALIMYKTVKTNLRIQARDRLQISRLKLSKFKWINWFIFPEIVTKTVRFTDDFRGNKK